jgi:hypothetical protein
VLVKATGVSGPRSLHGRLEHCVGFVDDHVSAADSGLSNVARHMGPSYSADTSGRSNRIRVWAFWVARNELFHQRVTALAEPFGLYSARPSASRLASMMGEGLGDQAIHIGLELDAAADGCFPALADQLGHFLGCQPQG